MRVGDQVQAIKDQKDAQAEIAKKIEANGGKADQNLDFLKRNNKIQIEELKLAQVKQPLHLNKRVRKI